MRARSSSASSSATFARDPRASGQSNPTRATFSPTRCARVSAGMLRGTPARTGRSPFSLALSFSQLRRTSSASVAAAVPKTCGCRWTSLSTIDATTSSMANAPSRRATSAWKTTWSKRSPSSSRSAPRSPESIASMTSQASSRVYLRRVSNVCSRSQGQPPSARSRLITPTRRAMVAPSCHRIGGTGRGASWSKLGKGSSTSGMPRGRLHWPGRMSTSSAPPPSAPFSTPTVRRALVVLTVLAIFALAYILRGVLVPLFFAFLLAYALDPFVDWLEARRVPRSLAAPVVMLTIAGLLLTAVMFAIPMFIDELRSAAADLPSQLRGLEGRLEPWLWQNFHFKPPHTMSELGSEIEGKLQSQFPDFASAASVALFGTLSYLAVILSTLIVPVFALYLLIDFDHIVERTAQLIPRRAYPQVAAVARQIHRTLGGYVRGQLTANIVLAALYAMGLRFIDIRLAVPIGVVTGMLAFVPYVGFACGLLLAVSMATLEWQGPGRLLGVLAVMLGVQVLDGLVVTPRIVGRSVGLAPLEVLLTMMAAGTLFGFLGVLLAVPLGAVVKILARRFVRAYLGSDFYLQGGRA